MKNAVEQEDNHEEVQKAIKNKIRHFAKKKKEDNLEKAKAAEEAAAKGLAKGKARGRGGKGGRGKAAGAGEVAAETAPKKPRKYPPKVDLKERTLESLNAALPDGCKMSGPDGCDSALRLTVWGGKQCTRSTRLHSEEAATLLIKIVWQIALDDGWETECPFPDLGVL
ncbi:unnamed protein product [Prorocentrum cordatum]|uniref:Uncharacterized protein n=1 Tax=Prorocentrum cordatum TaxID=2364126 RepID=A0ABN9XYC9_9DINO|nr:unnamed protein product [Polarella glacialis]|mmetsp:Transcript_67450/g.182242  ORF Transcript_67450/g.182242 Transcript_67450/m.182242 type:complete len:168 (-) Transcript_67450:6-509(-)